MSRMIRTQISLSREQMESLRHEARLRRTSIAAVVRQAVDAELERGASEAAWQRALSVAGAFNSGVGDIAERHDDYLADAYLE